MTPATWSPTGGRTLTPATPTAAPSATLPAAGSGAGAGGEEQLVIEGPLMRKHDLRTGGEKASDR